MDELSDAELEDSGSAGRSSDDGSHSGSDPVSSENPVRKTATMSSLDLPLWLRTVLSQVTATAPQLYLTTMAMILEMRGCLILRGKLYEINSDARFFTIFRVQVYLWPL